MLISELFANGTKGHMFGDSGVYSTYTDDIWRLFRDMQCEYGRCVSPVFMETKSRGTVKCGWVFQKAMEYEDSRTGETYIREVWVTFYADKHGRVLDLEQARKKQRARRAKKARARRQYMASVLGRSA